MSGRQVWQGFLWMALLWTLGIAFVELLQQITEPWLWPRVSTLGIVLILLFTGLRLRRIP